MLFLRMVYKFLLLLLLLIPMTDPAGAGRKMLTLIGGILMGSMEHHI